MFAVFYSQPEIAIYHKASSSNTKKLSTFFISVTSFWFRTGDPIRIILYFCSLDLDDSDVSSSGEQFDVFQ